MSDELLLKEIENLKQEKETLVVSKRGDNLLFAGIATATVVTASLQLWYGLIAVGAVWLFAWIRHQNNKPKPPPPTPTGTLIITESGYRYYIEELMSDGSKKEVAGSYIHYEHARVQLNWIMDQRRNKKK